MIIQAKIQDSLFLAELAAQLWSGHSVSALKDEFEGLTANPDAACFIKLVGEKPVGFALCQLRRDYVEGTSASPVGYLEGIFVIEEYRRRGIAQELVSSCERWAMQKGCTEFASDCEMDNELSLHFHTAVGFDVANRIICFRKDLK